MTDIDGWRSALRARLSSLSLVPAREAEIVEELSQHLEQRFRDLVVSGLSEADAGRAVLAEAEGAELARWMAPLRQAHVRETPPPGVPAGPFSGVRRDIVFAIRLFRRRRGVLSLAVLGLALAIGLTTVVFTAVNAIALRPMEVPHPEEVVSVRRVGAAPAEMTAARFAAAAWTFADFVRLRATATLMRVEAWSVSDAPPSADLDSKWYESTPLHYVSEGFLETLGARAFRGRLLTPDDGREGAPIVAVINYSFWARKFVRDPAIVGRTIHIGVTPVTIVGITERAFGGPTSARQNPAAFWVPLAKRSNIRSASAASPGSDLPLDRSAVDIIARLPSENALAAAQAEASAIATGLASDGHSVSVRLTLVDAPLSAESRGQLAFVLTVLVLVLVLACANVGNLLLASATTRQAEIGARLALGASRGRIVRQLLTESLLLGGVAGALGLWFAVAMGPTLAAVAWLPPTLDLTPDFRIFTFVVSVSIAASIAAGLAPARQASTRDVVSALKSGQESMGAAPRSSRLRNILIGTQAAASILLLVLASLFGRALAHSLTSHGFDIERLVAVTFGDWGTPQSRALPGLALERVRLLPDVESAALAVAIPFVGGWNSGALRGDPRDPLPVAVQNRATPDYFATLGLRVPRGRIFTGEETRANAPVAVITAGLAQRYWPNEEPLGSTLGRVHASLAATQIVGVSANVVTDVRRGESDVVFLPMADTNIPDTQARGVNVEREGRRLLVRARTTAASLLPSVSEAINALDPTLDPNKRPLINLVSDEFERRVGPVRVFAAVASILGAFAVVVAAIGLAGVSMFVVSQRAREVGVRLALGATRGDILGLLLRDGLRPVLIGLTVGLLVAVAASGLLASVLYGIGPRDPIAIATAAMILLLAAGMAVLVPANRAARLDPASVLRE